MDLTNPTLCVIGAFSSSVMALWCTQESIMALWVLSKKCYGIMKDPRAPLKQKWFYPVTPLEIVNQVNPGHEFTNSASFKDSLSLLACIHALTEQICETIKKHLGQISKKMYEKTVRSLSFLPFTKPFWPTNRQNLMKHEWWSHIVVPKCFLWKSRVIGLVEDVLSNPF